MFWEDTRQPVERGTCVRTYVYHGTYHGTMVQCTMVLSLVPWYYAIVLVPWYSRVPWYQRRGDIKVSKHGNTWILDVGVVCPGTPRSKRSTPTKTSSFRLSWRQVWSCHSCRVNKAARDWLDALTAPEPGVSQDDHPWNPQARTTTETVLREAMQALRDVSMLTTPTIAIVSPLHLA